LFFHQNNIFILNIQSITFITQQQSRKTKVTLYHQAYRLVKATRKSTVSHLGFDFNGQDLHQNFEN